MTKISQLPSDTPQTGDYYPALQASSTSTKRFSLANLITLIFNNIPAGSLTPTLMNNPYKFFYTREASWTASSTVLAMDTKVYDTGSNYSVSTGFFTCPVSGYYIFGGTAGYHTSGTGAIITSLAINGTAETWRFEENDNPLSSSNYHQSGSQELYCTSGTTVGLYVRDDTESNGIVHTTRFWGSLRSLT